MNELEAFDVFVDANTLIQVVPVKSQDTDSVGLASAADEPTALLVINKRGSVVTVETILAADSDGEFLPILSVSNNTVMPRSGHSEWLPDQYNNLIRATAVYNKVYQPDDFLQATPYIQPIGMYFIYYANGVDTVSYAGITYKTRGYEYTYPGFVDISGGVIYEHLVTRNVSSPASNTIYHQLNEYRTDRALYVMDGGGGQTGMSFCFYIVINGIPNDNYVTFNIQDY